MSFDVRGRLARSREGRMARTLAGSAVLVTGASSGIGRAAALEFAAKGSKVALLARDRRRLEAVAGEVHAAGGEPLVLTADVTDRARAEAAVRSVVERWGRLDVLVNNAGYLVKGSVEECLPEDFERQMAVNYLGAVYLTKAALPVMRRQGNGSIINVSSIAGRVYLPSTAAYQASKAALRAFTLTLRAELKGSGIAVSLITPGRTQTGIAEAAAVRGISGERHILGEMPARRIARTVVSCAQRPCREVVLPLPLRPLALAYVLAPDLVESGLPRLQAGWAWLRRQGDGQQAAAARLLERGRNRET